MLVFVIFSFLNNQCIQIIHSLNYSGKTKLVDILCKLSNRFCNIDTIDDSVTGSFQQVDLNRHLEEIAQKVETYLVCHQQNWLLNKNKSNASHFIKLLKEWESFVESSHCYQCGEFWNIFFFYFRISIFPNSFRCRISNFFHFFFNLFKNSFIYFFQFFSSNFIHSC